MSAQWDGDPHHEQLLAGFIVQNRCAAVVGCKLANRNGYLEDRPIDIAFGFSHANRQANSLALGTDQFDEITIWISYDGQEHT